MKPLASLLLVALLATGCAVRTTGPDLAQAPTSEAPLDPRRTRLDPRVCQPGGVRDLKREAAQVQEAERPVEAQHTARMLTFDRAAADAFGAAMERQHAELQHIYHAARFRALYPLAAEGNSYAVHAISTQYRWAESGFTDHAEWFRLLSCAALLGNPMANVQLMQWYWHERGDGSFADIQRNRSTALDHAERAADVQFMGGVNMLGVYIGAGRHQYPQSASIGRRLLTLCARTSDQFCKSALVEAVELGRSYGPEDPVETYLLLEDLAAAQPALYAAKRDSFRSTLSPAQLQASARSTAWRPASWADLKPEWLQIRRDILANGCPSASCDFGDLCTCPDALEATGSEGEPSAKNARGLAAGHLDGGPLSYARGEDPGLAGRGDRDHTWAGELADAVDLLAEQATLVQGDATHMPNPAGEAHVAIVERP
jgi:hypothetical protein